MLLSCWAIAEGSSFAGVVDLFCCCSRSLLACGCTGCGIVCAAAAAAAPSPEAPALVCDMRQHDLIYKHIYVHIHIYMCVCVYIHTHKHVCVCVCVCVCVYMYIYTHSSRGVVRRGVRGEPDIGESTSWRPDLFLLIFLFLLLVHATERSPWSKERESERET